MNCKTLSCTSCFEIGKTLLVVYKISLIFHIYIHILYITHFLQVVEFLIHTFRNRETLHVWLLKIALYVPECFC